MTLVWVSYCSSTGSIRDDSYWTSRKNSLELIELFSINKVCLVWVAPAVTMDQKEMILTELLGKKFKTDRDIQYK